MSDEILKIVELASQNKAEYKYYPDEEVLYRNPDDEEKQKYNSDSQGDNEHNGKHFIIQRGKAQCDQGNKFPNFKVGSHQKHYWNDANGENDFLAITEEDTTFNPTTAPFGQCRLKPTSGGYLPCSFTPLGKWEKVYDKVKVMDRSCLTELSELNCCVGGKITVLSHGQQSATSLKQVSQATFLEQKIYNPIVDFEEFKDIVETRNLLGDYK